MDYKEVEDEANFESDSSTTSSIARIPMPAGPPPDEYIAVSAKAEVDLHEEHQYSNINNRDPILYERSPSLDQVRQSKDLDHVSQVSPISGLPKVVYSANPVLRDLRQESTTFVPKALKRYPRSRRASSTRDPMTHHLPDAADDAQSVSVISDQRSTDISGKRRINLAPAIR